MKKTVLLLALGLITHDQYCRLVPEACPVVDPSPQPTPSPTVAPSTLTVFCPPAYPRNGVGIVTGTVMPHSSPKMNSLPLDFHPAAETADYHPP